VCARVLLLLLYVFGGGMCSLVGEVQVVSAGRRIPSSEGIKWLSRPIRILDYWPAVHYHYPQQLLQSPAALPSAQLRSEIKGTLSADSDGKAVYFFFSCTSPAKILHCGNCSLHRFYLNPNLR
jgi:hypothetical protein